MSADSVPVELVADPHNVIGEGPVSLENAQRLTHFKSGSVQAPGQGH
jgi:hypothetical protein